MSRPTQSTSSLFRKIILMILSFGPGIFAIGHTIGTGSVTSMIVAGSAYGMQLLWVLLVSCLFTGLLMYSYGKYALVTGETALFGVKNHLKGGKIIAIAIILGVSFAQWNSLIGIVGLSSNLIFEILIIYFPPLVKFEYQAVLVIAILVMGTMYLLLLVGKYSFFEKILVIFVTIMGGSFLFSLFLVHPLPIEVVEGLLPTIPREQGGKMMVVAFVGTTMAAATFLSRPLFIQGKGWTIKDLGIQKKDAIVAAVLIFIISGSIMAVAHGALFHQGKPVTHVLDMVGALEPVAGKFALTLFFFGTLSAGLSSVFPILMIAPLLLADYQSGKLDSSSKQFRIITGIACIVALTVPIFGANPIQVQIVSQVFNVFVLPIVIIGIILLLNNKGVMKHHSTNIWIQSGLVLAFLFSCVISYNGILALLDY
ncbi:MAG: Nramp family divalent metal transporter [Cyclobacteriaceae bacterium]|nr:Nramp family divalent metal transporter [Cyclobacteriaceae bacterium]